MLRKDIACKTSVENTAPRDTPVLDGEVGRADVEAICVMPGRLAIALRVRRISGR